MRGPVPIVALLAATSIAISLSLTATADEGPNQGDPRLVLTVDDPAIACDAVPGDKIEGGHLGPAIEVTSTDPIDRVTVKSGAGASVLHSRADQVDGMYRLVFELDQDVGNYVVWTCPSGATAPRARPEPEGSPLASSEPGSSSAPSVGGVDDDPAAAVLARFPDEVSGHRVASSAFSAVEWLTAANGGDPSARTAMETLASSASVAFDDIVFVTGLIEPTPGNHATVTAIGLPGADSRLVVHEVIAVIMGDIVTPRIVADAVGGKAVLRVTDAAMPGTYPRHLYAAGETVFIVEADEPLRTDILASLP